MNLVDIIAPESVAVNIDATSKKRALEKLSEMIVSNSSNLAPQDVCESLIARERLGSTAIGSGVAIPHGRVKNADKTVAAFIKLHHGIDYDAVDDQNVDMLFALLVPEESTDEHLQILAELAELFSNPTIREKLRATQDNADTYQLISNWKQYR